MYLIKKKKQQEKLYNQTNKYKSPVINKRNKQIINLSKQDEVKH